MKLRCESSDGQGIPSQLLSEPHARTRKFEHTRTQHTYSTFIEVGGTILKRGVKTNEE